MGDGANTPAPSPNNRHAPVNGRVISLLIFNESVGCIFTAEFPKTLPFSKWFLFSGMFP